MFTSDLTKQWNKRRFKFILDIDVMTVYVHTCISNNLWKQYFQKQETKSKSVTFLKYLSVLLLLLLLLLFRIGPLLLRILFVSNSPDTNHCIFIEGWYQNIKPTPDKFALINDMSHNLRNPCVLSDFRFSNIYQLNSHIKNVGCILAMFFFLTCLFLQANRLDPTSGHTSKQETFEKY